MVLEPFQPTGIGISSRVLKLMASEHRKTHPFIAMVQNSSDSGAIVPYEQALEQLLFN
jgi:hypothetical protein